MRLSDLACLMFPALNLLSFQLVFRATEPAPLLLSPSGVVETFNGWFVGGGADTQYMIRRDSVIKVHGLNGAYVSGTNVEGSEFETLFQTIRADRYRGKRIRFSAFIKTENLDRSAGIWMRIDGVDRTLAYDNKGGGNIVGTNDWQRYEAVLDVPGRSAMISYGVLLNGNGRMWIDSCSFGLVSRRVLCTAESIDPIIQSLPSPKLFPSGPINLDFEY